jgi:hypothetical protein
MADRSHSQEVHFDELVQPARLQLPLLDPQVARQKRRVAAGNGHSREELGRYLGTPGSR